MPHPHDELALAAARGDREAFGKLYDLYVHAIHRFLVGHGLRRDQAEDLVSQTFLKALDRIHRFDPKRGPFPAWLYTLARNTFIDQYRRGKREVPADMELEADSRDAEASGRDADRLKAVQKAILELEPEQRELVMLRVWEEKSYDEIAAILGKRADALKMAFSRAVARLKQALPPLLVLFSLFHSGLRSRA